MTIAILVLNSLILAAMLLYVYKSAYERGFKAAENESKIIIEQLAEANRALTEEIETKDSDQTSVCFEYPPQYYKRILH